MSVSFTLEELSNLIDEKLKPIIESNDKCQKELTKTKKMLTEIIGKSNGIGQIVQSNSDALRSLKKDNRMLNDSIMETKSVVKNVSVKSTGGAKSTTSTAAFNNVVEFWESLDDEQKAMLPNTNKKICGRDKGKSTCDKKVVEVGDTDTDGNSVPTAHFCNECLSHKVTINVLKKMMGLTGKRGGSKQSNVTKPVNHKATMFKTPKKVKTVFLVDDDEYGTLNVHEDSGLVINSDNEAIFIIDEDGEYNELTNSDMVNAKKLGFNIKGGTSSIKKVNSIINTVSSKTSAPNKKFNSNASRTNTDRRKATFSSGGIRGPPTLSSKGSIKAPPTLNTKTTLRKPSLKPSNREPLPEDDESEEEEEMQMSVKSRPLKLSKRPMTNSRPMLKKLETKDEESEEEEETNNENDSINIETELDEDDDEDDF